MFAKKKWLITILVLLVLYGFKQADEYFEISKNLEIFSAVYKTVQSDYVDEVKPGDIMKTGIDAMLKSLDPYTNFYTESQAEDAMIRQRGEYGGVGCRSKKIGEYICITNVFKGLAADKSGLRIGDKIIEINGKSFVNKTDDEVSDVMKGSPGSKINLTIEREGKRIPIEITREEIKINNVTYSGLINEKTGYIRLDHFTMGAGTEVKEALLRLKSQGISQLVLDLRDNGGGLLHEAVNIVNIFVDMDETVVVSRGRAQDAYRAYKTLDRPIDKEIPLIVLVNERSASASEIVCGAIQDLDRGLVIGANTFGKGLVQGIRPLPYRTQMKVTIAKYYIPSGRCIQLLDYSNKDENGKAKSVADSLKREFKTRNGRSVFDGGGVKPDIEVKLPKTAQIITDLENSFLFFDFANQYRNSIEHISSIKDFKIDENIFNSFVDFVSKKSFSSKNKSEINLDKLKESLREDSLFNSELNTSISNLELKLLEAKKAELLKHKVEIKKRLLTEIGIRYYFEDGFFESSFLHDPYISETLEVLSQTSKYNNLLNTK
ncbi:MAG: S41 family peptidase [Bacteroidia bacterium]